MKWPYNLGERSRFRSQFDHIRFGCEVASVQIAMCIKKTELDFQISSWLSFANHPFTIANGVESPGFVSRVCVLA